MCFGCTKEPSHPEGSFEYPQHMFWLRNKKKYFQLLTLIWGPANAGLENSTCPLIFTSASGCRASEKFDISGEN